MDEQIRAERSKLRTEQLAKDADLSEREVALLMADTWNATIDWPLLRLALPAGDHTFHEVMLGCQLVKPELTYSDTYRRYRHLPPLGQDELRKIAPNGRFPDEVISTLKELEDDEPVQEKEQSRAARRPSAR